ncbi:MAG: circadian clock protein KaiC [Limisphaerales bacterium]
MNQENENELRAPLRRLAKVRTGIAGLDEITHGGLPGGRTTLICGGPGCGKTVLALEFLVHGAREFDEPGLLVSFEESAPNLVENARSLGFDLEDLVRKKKLKISHVDFSAGEIIETGQFSLEGLLIRLKQGIAEVGAKRVVLDTLETVFAALSDTPNLRNEVARIFHWLRNQGLTAIVTGERGGKELTRHGFEEYISDCVLLLDHRVTEQVSKRRMRIIKYRGSAHATDEFPFLIGERGFTVLPITALQLDYSPRTERVSTGVQALDELLGGKGYYKATTVLVTGKAGTGKSTLGAAFAAAACARGERCLYLSFEEAAGQLVRNMKSVGFDLAPWQEKKLLSLQAFRPTVQGLEEHLIRITHIVDNLKPECVVLDPITNFITVGGPEEVRSMLMRILDHLKQRGMTLFLTALTRGSGTSDETETAMSSLVDTWIALDLAVVGHARRREIHIVKSRGMQHSHQTHELVMSAQGLSLRNLTAEEAR